MLIKVKNKASLIIDDFVFKCSIGKNGIKKNKKEGDKSTPKGKFTLGILYYRGDKVQKPITNLKIKKITKKMGWCNDPMHKKYNKEILIEKKIKFEKLFRKDNIYDYFIVINYNSKKTIPNKGSAIFLHLTKNYKPTLGCIALNKKDFLILAKIINKNSKIKIG
jgi:L,D-peptidoglycan transpeptidase YkuD (ErfK/YbiS/YcfS/YnhG family)